MITCTTASLVLDHDYHRRYILLIIFLDESTYAHTKLALNSLHQTYPLPLDFKPFLHTYYTYIYILLHHYLRRESNSRV